MTLPELTPTPPYAETYAPMEPPFPRRRPLPPPTPHPRARRPRNQRKKAALADAKARCAALDADNTALAAELQSQRREARDAAEHLRGELLAKAAQVAQLQVGGGAVGACAGGGGPAHRAVAGAVPPHIRGRGGGDLMSTQACRRAQPCDRAVARLPWRQRQQRCARTAMAPASLHGRPQDELDAARTHAEDAMQQLRSEAAARERAAAAAADARAQELHARADALQAELDGVADFRERQVCAMRMQRSRASGMERMHGRRMHGWRCACA